MYFSLEIFETKLLTNESFLLYSLYVASVIESTKPLRSPKIFGMSILSGILGFKEVNNFCLVSLIC